MTDTSTKITVGTSSFDLAGVGNWVSSNLGVVLLFALIAFIFFLFRKDGFAEKLLAYRLRVRELDAKKLDDIRVVTDILIRKYDRVDPLLPFDGLDDRK